MENLRLTKPPRKAAASIRAQVDLSQFSNEVEFLIKQLSNSFTVTYASSIGLQQGRSHYSYCLLKPCSIISRAFRLEREVLCVFSEYDQFEPRTLSAFEKIRDEFEHRGQRARISTACQVIIAKDKQIEGKIRRYLSENNDIPATVPFSFIEGGRIVTGEKNIGETAFVEQRFRQSFHCQDLFCYRNPLKNDSLFYGRANILSECVGRHRAGENTGIFGLRKSGKTSVLYALQRQLDKSDSITIFLDCNKFSLNRWNQVLGFIVREYKRKLESRVKLPSVEEEYDPANAQQLFSDDFFRVYESRKPKKVLLMFDEIERITPETGSGYWRSDEDFVYFWRAIRHLTQAHTDKCTYMISGTNPCAIEQTYWYSRLENPIFQHAKPIYLPPFQFEELKLMLNDIGFYMGLEFEDDAIHYLRTTFGGHPFLTRQACSGLYRKITDQPRPIRVNAATWTKYINESLEYISAYLKLIVDALQFYPDEYEMLKIMITEGSTAFEEYAENNPELVHHLLGYGILSRTPLGYAIAIECIRDHLTSKWKYNRRSITQEEKELELSARRNALERKLRRFIKRQLKQTARAKAASHQELTDSDSLEENCIKKIYRSLCAERRDRLQAQGYTLDDFFSGNSPLYLLELASIIDKNWADVFSGFFGEPEKARVKLYLHDINSSQGGGRNDCHAKDISEKDFEKVRTEFDYFERLLEDE